MTEAIVGEIVGAGEWTPQEAADHVRAAWQGAVESIVETGRRLMEAKRRVGHGRWLDAVALMPFGDSTARKLMQIAQHPDLSNREHVTDLPASWGTLSILAQLPPGEIPRRIQAHEITAELERAKAQEMASTFMAARQESLNAYSEAVDGLTRALSYAKTYAPPEDIPDNYVSVAEFVERLEALRDIAVTWKDGE
jgi:exonuclease VII large subunit